jgi:phage-related minor tail protein
VLSRSKLETNGARMTSAIKAFESRISERPSRAESDAHSDMTKKLERTRRLLNLLGESAKEAEEHMDVTRYVVYKSGGKEFSSVIDSVQDIRVDMRRWKGIDEIERTLESVLDSMYELKASSALWAPQLAILGYIEQKMEDAMEELTKARKSLKDVDTRELAMEETLTKLQDDDKGE